MAKSLRRPGLFLLSLVAAWTGLFVVPVASRSAHGRVTELGGIPYFVGDVAVSQILDLPISISGDLDQTDVDLFPLTIISSETSVFTGAELNETITEFMRKDDVFSPSFLQGQSSPSKE